MKKIYFLVIGAMLPVLMGSCSDSFNAQDAAGEGRLILRPSVSTDMKASRAVEGDELQKLNDECIIWISSSKGLVRKYDGIGNVPAEGIWLVGGQYTAEAWAGDSVPASFDARYFKGVEIFDINAGGTTQVNLNCRIANTAVAVKYAENIDEVLSDYVLTVGHSCGKLAFEERDSRRGYFMMNSRDKDLTFTLTGTRQDGSAYSYEGKIDGAKPSTEYILNVNYEGTDVETGGAYFTIEIDESTIDMEETIEIISAPNIVGYGFDINEPVYGEAGKLERKSIYIAAAAELTSVAISMPSIIDVNGGEFDMIRAQESVYELLSSKGINRLRVRDEANDLDNLKISFEPELLNSLGDGTYEINVTASIAVQQRDGNDNPVTVTKSNTTKMTIVVSDADVQVEPMASNDPSIWATEVTLTGKVMKDGVEAVGFKYREKGAVDWIDVEGAVSRASIAKGSTYRVVLSDLKPGTTYEYVATAGDFTANTIYEFTTEAAAQLPNAGFEDWCTVKENNKDVTMICADVNSLFWDSGNHGSATMGKMVTYAEGSIVNSGSKSVCLQSQFVGIGALGKFAAGNIFIGKYLKTDGTDGVLGWGRPFNSRPKALKGYVKYTPAVIDNDKDLSQAPNDIQTEFAKGNMDKGIVYVALLDNSKSQGDTDYPDYPVVVKTKKPKHLFDKSGSDVIAYGEIIFSEGTDGSGLVEFTIPLVYNRMDIKPSYIMCTASASKAGDYFTGGPSKMYLDDLELVY